MESATRILLEIPLIEAPFSIPLLAVVPFTGDLSVGWSTGHPSRVVRVYHPAAIFAAEIDSNPTPPGFVNRIVDPALTEQRNTMILKDINRQKE